MTIEPIALDDPRAADATVTWSKAAGLARLRLSGFDVPDVFRMLAGHSPATRAANEALDRLRARARAVEGLVDALGAATEQPIEVLAQFDEELSGAVIGWIDEHGWAMVNYDPGVAVLAERPATIVKLLLNNADRASFSDADEVADRARVAIRPERRTDFDAALAAARAIYPVREDNAIVVGDRPLALLRRWMLEVARRLVDRGRLGSTTDAAYLTIDELRRAVEDADGLQLDHTVRRRRGEEAWVRANPGPAHLASGARCPTSRAPRPRCVP